MLSNGIDLIDFVDDAQLRIKGVSASVYIEPHKVRLLPVHELSLCMDHQGAAAACA